jgi:hypothetical protein
LKPLREWPTPKNKIELRCFLGLCTYYRSFISGFEKIAKQPTTFTEEKQAFQWTQEVEDAFQTLNGAFCTAPILAYPHPGERLFVDTDSSNFGIGRELSRVQDGQESVIAYYSKTLNKTEGNYCVTRRELLPIVRTLEHFHKYLYGKAIHLRTDHSALTWLMNFKNLEGQSARCVQRLQEYNFTSEHRQGQKQKYANALSRRPRQKECRHCHKVELRADIKQVGDISALPAADWDPLVLRTEQLNDTDIGPILQEVETGRRTERKNIADRNPKNKSYLAQWKSLAIRDGVLERKWESANGRTKVAQNSTPL